MEKNLKISQKSKKISKEKIKFKRDLNEIKHFFIKSRKYNETRKRTINLLKLNKEIMIKAIKSLIKKEKYSKQSEFIFLEIVLSNKIVIENNQKIPIQMLINSLYIIKINFKKEKFHKKYMKMKFQIFVWL